MRAWGGGGGGSGGLGWGVSRTGRSAPCCSPVTSRAVCCGLGEHCEPGALYTPPKGLGMRSPEHASHLTLDSLQSTSPFAIADIIIPVYKHRVRSPVYKLWLPERALSVSPLDLFNLNSEPLSHGQAAVNSIPVTGSLTLPSTQPKSVSRAWGLETEGP